MKVDYWMQYHNVITNPWRRTAADLKLVRSIGISQWKMIQLYWNLDIESDSDHDNKNAELSLTNPRDASE